MNSFSFSLAGARLEALGSGALWWPEQRLLCFSDLHLGKSERHARRGGPALPPYETRDTLERLQLELERTSAHTVICLGDSFDDMEAAGNLPEAEKLWISRLQVGRQWIWIEGNHDPGPIETGGTHLAEYVLGPLTFRHIALAGSKGEISGHYHPKTRLSRGTRPSFLLDSNRLILPAFGTYTGGLRSSGQVLRHLMQNDALAILTGDRPLPVPLDRVI